MQDVVSRINARIAPVHRFENSVVLAVLIRGLVPRNPGPDCWADDTDRLLGHVAQQKQAHVDSHLCALQLFSRTEVTWRFLGFLTPCGALQIHCLLFFFTRWCPGQRPLPDPDPDQGRLHG
jgi:hypothetical protein